MKKLLLIFPLMCVALNMFGEDTIPNASFENWTEGIYSYPENYSYNSNADYIQYFINDSMSFNVKSNTTAYHGAFAAELTTKVIGQDTLGAYMLNFSPEGENPTTWHGGIPYTEMPAGIRFYYKYNVETEDSALMIINFCKDGSSIGTYMANFGGLKTAYTLFELNFTPALSEAPDSVGVAFASSYNVVGSGKGKVVDATLIIDSVSFTGVTSQPDDLNGDFKLWEKDTVEVLSEWFVTESVYKTEDKQDGSYAVRLETYLSMEDSVGKARAGLIMSGYYSASNNYSYPLGGHPFSNTTDTLTFYYKYTPVNNDSALVLLFFKDSTTTISHVEGINLHESADYQYVELPFSLGFTPDSIIIQIQSSDWRDSSAAFVGSVLIIDQLEFKSQGTTSQLFNTLKNELSIYPNPVNDAFRIEGFEGNATMTISDVSGRMLLTKQINAGETITTNGLSSGLYIISLKNEKGAMERKIIKE